MVELVLGDGGHTFDASAKEITLAAPYTTLSEGQILKIVNLTVGAVLYDATVRRYPISISGAVITHTYDNTGMADADLLQVTIDIGGTSSPILADIEGVTAKNAAATENPLLNGAEFETLGALTTDGSAAGDKVPAKASQKGVPYITIVDSDGAAEVSVKAANTARTTATVVQGVQHIGADGNPMPSGIVTDPIFVDVNNDAEVATTPVIYNVTMTNLDTEYSQLLPANTKIVSFRCQDVGFTTRYSYETGKVATPTAPYRNLFAGEERTVEGLNLTTKTLYFACGTAGKVMEIECWS